MKWKKKSDFHNPEDTTRYVLSAPKKMARGCKFDGGIEISACWNFNGSGSKAFGGAVRWPVAKLSISFEEGQIKDRDTFIKALKKFLDDYFK